jgi:ribonuclease VapC
MVMIGAFDLHGRALLARFREEKEIVVIPFDERHWSLAAEAFIRFGKGRHPAALNYGDCMTYATARRAGAPLLYVGDDFAKTDISAA